MTDNRTAAQGGRMRPQSFKEAFSEAKYVHNKSVFEYPPGSGNMFSTKTAEEQGREIGAKAAAGSGRGPSAGRTASDRDTTSGPAEIPTGGTAKAPAESGERTRASLSDIPGLIARGMAKGAERVPAGRGLGAAFTAAGAARAAGAGAAGALARREAANKVAEAERLASRIDPMHYTSRTAETGKFRRNEAPLSEARRQAREEMAAEPEFKKGGKVKTYAKGGSVRGAGIAQRGVRNCKVY